MKSKTLICIVCPNGCELEIEINESPSGIEVGEVTGSLCDKGPVWAKQELINPMRTIASNVLVSGGDFCLVSVRTDIPIPREKIFPVMERIKALRVEAPINTGDILISNPADCECNIIATRTIMPG